MQHPQLQILFDLDTESKFCFVAICIEHQRVSKDSLSLLCPQFSSCAFVLEREVAFSAENITPVKITRGKRGAQRARNSLCTRKCIKGENVIYRVHAQNSRERWSCVREWRRGRWKVVGGARWGGLHYGGAALSAEMKTRVRSRSLGLPGFRAPRYNLP